MRRFRPLVWLLVVGLWMAACQERTRLPEATPLVRRSTAGVVVTPSPLPEDMADQGLALLPQAQNDLQSLSTLSRYTIQVTLSENTYQGRLQLVTTNTEPVDLERLYFRLFPNGGLAYGNGSLMVSNLTVDGEPASTQLSLSDSVLEVRLPISLPVGESVRVVMDFAGQTPIDFGSPDGYGLFNYTRNVLTLTGGFPLLAVYDDEGWNLDSVSAIGDSVYADDAFFTVEVTADSTLKLATTGMEVSSQPQEEQTLHRYVSGPAREFALLASPDFQMISQKIEGLQLNSYYLPGHRAGGQQAAEIAAEAIKTFNNRFGLYPYTELDLVGAPLQYALGVEFPGLVLMSDAKYGQSSEAFFIDLVAHEVAHQWWYNVVGNNVIDDPWLDEALASYSSAVYWQDVVGEEAYGGVLQYFQGNYDAILRAGLDDWVTESVPHFEADSKTGMDAYVGVVYSKGALFFNAVREAIGDEAFFRALREYYAARKYQIATVDDLLRAFEIASGKQLDELYRAWLYSP